MLWDSVFEFFVKHVFGGNLINNGQRVYYSATLGALRNSIGNWVSFGLANYDTGITFISAGETHYLSMGNYLSLIATIITMVIIVTLCALFILKIIKLIGGLIR